MAKKTPKKPMETHVDRTTTPYTGPLTVDATTVSAILVDLPPGARKGLRTPFPGIDEVAAELAAVVPTDGPPAGVSPAVYQSFVTNQANTEKLAQLSQTLSKLGEVVLETLSLTEDAREQDPSRIVDSVRSTAKRTKNAGILAPFQKTVEYKAQAADKGVKTKEKKKAAATTPAATTTTPPVLAPAATPATGH